MADWIVLVIQEHEAVVQRTPGTASGPQTVEELCEGDEGEGMTRSGGTQEREAVVQHTPGTASRPQTVDDEWHEWAEP